MSIVYLNGEYLPIDKAHISVLDRGFMFGDSIYEIIPAYSGQLFRLEQHLQRLDRSLKSIRLVNPLTPHEWQQMLQRLLEKNGAGDQSVYLQVTRGVAERDHVIPPQITPTVFAMCQSMDQGRKETGVAAVTLTDFRWKRCDIKATTLLPNVLLRQEADDRGATEAILLREGRVTEGAASNVFIVLEGVVKTPPKSHLLLPGITRDFVLELLASAGIPHQEIEIGKMELRRAEEIWVTSSTREIVPVIKLDDQPVGDGRPGHMWGKVISLYQAHKRAPKNAATARAS
ncbi:MAG: D-amino acid aminotransferase [Gammaproteobacteria bacterium]|jgi:D-alanine transaminase